ncbi:MAG: ferrous iron transport protein A [Lachnospiraceae bacterium]|nr:ferrous iron transport protein A [Lachnospiraceae bacterium]
MMPLTLSNPGEKQVIVKVAGNEKTRKFLENLGFVQGEEISVVSSLNGNLIVNVKDSRVAVDQAMASKIYV